MHKLNMRDLLPNTGVRVVLPYAGVSKGAAGPAGRRGAAGPHTHFLPATLPVVCPL